MTSASSPSLEEARVLAQRAGLPLTEEQVVEILPGLVRGRQMQRDIRELVGDADEPAGAFDAAAGH